jgi:hypothetical protein
MNTIKLNSVVQIQDTVADIEQIGLLGYISEITTTTYTVAVYYAAVKGENAHVQYITVLHSQVHYVGECNPNLTPL